MKESHIKYVLGIDNYDVDISTYTLVRIVDGEFDIILTKKIKNKEDFAIEVENLSNYFNASIVMMEKEQ